MPEPSDSDLVRRVRTGDDDSYAELVRRHQGLVYGCAYRILSNATDAQEVAQDTFVRFHRFLAHYDEARDLRSYLATIAANLARNAWQKRQRFPGISLNEDEAPDLPDPRAEVPGAALASGELRAQLTAAMARLPGRLGDICNLFYLAEMSCRDIAESLAMSETAVKVSLHRARQRLLVELKPLLDGGTLPV